MSTVCKSPPPSRQRELKSPQGMGSGTSPLDIPELIEHCVGFLHNSTLDLRACSLVNRTQSHIFSEIVLGISGVNQDNHMRVSRLLEILEATPHLAGFILTLRVNARIAGLGNFLRICSLPFTCLRILYIAGGSNLSPQAYFGIRGLLSFPTIESLSIFCGFTNTDNFLRIWELCSANLKYLLLGTSILTCRHRHARKGLQSITASHCTLWSSDMLFLAILNGG
jgi:hypothetical protein